MTALLASVRSLDEARLAQAGGADIIDLKEPIDGALGAVPVSVARAVTYWIDGRTTVSATIGDLQDATAIATAVRAMAACNVDIVKVGLFNPGERQRALDALQPLAASGVRLVAVLFADRSDAQQLTEISDIASAGLFGAMIDTAGKHDAGLLGYQPMSVLRGFVDGCRRLGLRSGLAGSLTRDDIAGLLPIAPDYLGFRGALCRDGERGSQLDIGRLAGVRRAIPRQDLFAIDRQHADSTM